MKRHLEQRSAPTGHSVIRIRFVACLTSPWVFLMPTHLIASIRFWGLCSDSIFEFFTGQVQLTRNMEREAKVGWKQVVADGLVTIAPGQEGLLKMLLQSDGSELSGEEEPYDLDNWHEEL